MKSDNDEEKEKSDKQLEDNSEKKDNDDNIILLNKKIKLESNLLEEELSPYKNKQKKLENQNTPKKIIEYDYGYIIYFLESEEKGLMEDFLPNNTDSSDFFNYGLDKETFEKMLRGSILHHYENHLKEEKEKRDKMNMFMLNMNINMNMNNMGNNFIPRGMNNNAQMNNLMMNNNINYNGIIGENNNINRNLNENKQQISDEDNK